MEDIDDIIKPRGSEQLMPKIGPPEPRPDFGDTGELWKAILKVQKALEPFVPMGKMEMGSGDKKKLIPYVTKNQILTETQKLLTKNGIVCAFEGVKRIDWVKQHIVYRNNDAGKQELHNIHLRYWCEYSFRHVETGAAIFRIAPGDAMGTDCKHSTVAMAFALRDCQAQMFQVSADQDTISLEELQFFSADEVATKMGMEDITAGLRVKAQFLVQNLGIGPIQKVAKSIKFKPSTWEVDDMKLEDIAGIIGIGIDMINSGSEKEALKNVGGK
jgi:hypothetical protein